MSKGFLDHNKDIDAEAAAREHRLDFISRMEDKAKAKEVLFAPEFR